jgi:SpoVK/Ycf46/Vps4 family AAA+-type ATPase
MDGAGTSRDDRILVIGATNRPQELDEAVRRRLSRRLYIPLPCIEGRQQLIHNLLQQVPHQLGPQDLALVVTRTKGYSGADLQNLCSEAAMNPVRSAGDISCLTAESLRPIELADFMLALEVVKPTVAQEDLSKLVAWNCSFGSFQFDLESLQT